MLRFFARGQGATNEQWGAFKYHLSTLLEMSATFGGAGAKEGGVKIIRQLWQWAREELPVCAR